MRYLPKSPAPNVCRCSPKSALLPSTTSSPSSRRVPPRPRPRRPSPARRERDHRLLPRPRQQTLTGFASFLGAGAYRHYRPVIIDSLVQRGEFLTSYTPYQAEITQGTLQAIFEFQTMIAELTGMDVANASMYDGSTGAAEAVMMAVRVTGRHKAVVARTVHPEYREVIATYAKHQGLPSTLVPYDRKPAASIWPLSKSKSPKTAAVLVQSPNFFGVIEDIPAIAAIAHAKGALLIVSIAEAISLGVVRPPVEADIVSMEAQSFGVALSYGGPSAASSRPRKSTCARCPAASSAKPSIQTATGVSS
jgi:glycine dehydrogenase subunit 1